MKDDIWRPFLAVVFALALGASPLRAQETKKEALPEAKKETPQQAKPEAKKEEAPKAGEDAAKYSLSLEPALRWVNVSGDEEKFREHWWIDHGWAGGGEFSFSRQIAKDVKLDMAGRGIWNDQDFKLGMGLEKKDVGFIRADFSQYRKFFDGTGGFYQRFRQPHVRSQDLDMDDLALNIGDLNVDIGLRAPNLPKITLGYEHQYKDGKKSMLEWGPVTQQGLVAPPFPAGSITKNIFPAFKDIDETVDSVKLNVQHDISNIHLEDDFRWDHYRNRTNRVDDVQRSFAAGGGPGTLPTQTAYVRETLNHDAFSNVFSADSHLNDKAYVSMGYLFTALDGSAGMRVLTDPATPGTIQWRTHHMDLSEDSHVVNAHFMLGPYASLTGYGGVQGEVTDTSGFGFADVPSALNPNLRALMDTSRDKSSVEEHAGLRFTGLPFTVLYAEGRWTEQDLDLFRMQPEQDTPGGPFTLLPAGAFEQLTDTEVFRQMYTVGGTTSPLRGVTLSARYRRTMRDNDYNHKIDIEQGGSGFGSYPAFITSQAFFTDEVQAKASWRPTTQLSLSFMYQLADTTYRTSTQAGGGKLKSGVYDSNTFSSSATYTPLPRLYVTGTASYENTSTHAYDNGSFAIQMYRGNVLSFIGTIGYILDAKSDLTLNYIVSTSNNFRNNGSSQIPIDAFGAADYGLPLGLDYQQHGLTVGFKRKISDNLTVGLNYGLFVYDEGSNGHVNDYIANLVSGNLSLKF